MRINKLILQNYRNIQYQEFMPSDELTVICGKNGQGKTNLLEGIWMLTGAKSFRGSKDAEIIKTNEQYAILNAECFGYEKDSEIRVSIGSLQAEKKGRYAKVNGVDYSRASNIAGIFTAVVFAPNHLSLIKGSAEGRRKLIDAALCQLYPSYISVLRRHNRVLAQKNALLKQKNINRELLSAFNDAMAEEGEKISIKRREYVEIIKGYAIDIYTDISKKSEELTLIFEPCYSELSLRETLENAIQADIRAGFCTKGAHREDFLVSLNGQQAKIFASQGQQRSCVLSLKLAEALAAQKITGEHPVMLLDDVLSELDYERQEYLLNEIKNKQAIVTACDRAAFLKTTGTIFEVDTGKINSIK